MTPHIAPSVDVLEIDKFSRLAAQWWDPDGAFAPLHRFNPIRLQFIRDVAAQHFGRETRTRNPFAGLSLLDLGCGGGLLSEPMARLGFRVLGCDASESNVGAASAHADPHRDLPLAYRAATAEELAAEKSAFDVVLNMEVVEHVADVSAFLRTAASLVRPGGLMFVATINKTLKSLALGKIAAEYVLRWLPTGTHEWSRFIPPRDLRRMLEAAGTSILREQGMTFDPVKWTWKLSPDLDVNYVLVAHRS